MEIGKIRAKKLNQNSGGKDPGVNFSAKMRILHIFNFSKL